MIRDGQFVLSRKQFAIDLSTVTGKLRNDGDRWTFSGQCSAVWYRRKDRVTRACIGTVGLWNHYLPGPLDLTDPVAVLSARLDGRYGGDCHGRWDGTGYWGAEDLDVQAEHLAVLRPMLDVYPTCPASYDGWWRFDA